MKFSHLGIGVFLALCVVFTISCQSQSDYMFGSSAQPSEIDASLIPSKKDKEKRWKERFVYVTRVIDGDTFWVDNGSDKFKVRFIGIDAPEVRNSRWKEKGYYAQEAKAYVQKLTEKKWVRLEMDVQSHDRYQRLLAYIYLEDGTFLNADLVEQGYAVVDTYPPNVKYVDRFIALQKKARRKSLGLWAEDF